MTNKKIVAHVSAAILLAAAAVQAFGQTALIRPAYQYPDVPPAYGPANIRLGSSPVYLTPYVGFAAGRDDNVNFSADNEKASTLYLFSPGFRLDARHTNKVVQMAYQAQVGRYAQSDADDYEDHAANAQFDWALDRRNFVRVALGYVRGHDPRGLTDRPVGGTPDEYRLVSPNLTYALGSHGARGRVELYYGMADKKYLNNRATTRLSDRETSEFGGAFYWRVMPRTYLLAEARESRIRYDFASSPLSADERRYFGGVSWEATAATTGTFKIGRLKREFLSDLPDGSATSWEATVSWAPRTYSKFDLYTVRTTNEATGIGSFLLSSITGITWNHAWSSFVSTGIDLRYQKDDYQNFDRTDDTRSIGLKIGYKFRRWLTLGAEYTYSQRDSNIPRFEYDRNLYLLTVTGSL